MARGLVIGAGPSIFKFNHLELLAKSDYDGSLLITDRMLIPCLNSGIIPDKFKMYVFSIEDMQVLSSYFPNIEDSYKINVIHSQRVRRQVLEHIVSLGYNLKCDYWEYLQISSNVGLMAFCYGWRVLKLDEIAMIGLDHSVASTPDTVPFSENSECFKNCYVRQGNVVLAPNHQMWLEAFYDLLQLTPKELKIINCTEGGAIKHERIKEMEFRDYLW